MTITRFLKYYDKKKPFKQNIFDNIELVFYTLLVLSNRDHYYIFQLFLSIKIITVCTR